MAPKGKDNSNARLFYDGRSWDLTNLVQKGQATRVEQAPNRIVSKYRPRREIIPETSLYPSPDELQDSALDFIPAAEAFREAAVKTSTSPPGAFHSAPNSSSCSYSPTQRPFSRSQTKQTPLPGAFPSSNTIRRPKPPLPSWVEEPNELAKKLKGTCVIDDSCSSRTESTYSRSSTNSSSLSEDPYVDIYRHESSRSMQSTGSAGPVARVEDGESTPPAAVTSRSQIEVAPGIFMPLRGSTETLAAVESRMARTVSCIACQATLRCVPDAELVICPDCFLLSPLEQHDHSRSRIKSQPGVEYQVGGVGLGLKVNAGGR